MYYTKQNFHQTILNKTVWYSLVFEQYETQGFFESLMPERNRNKPNYIEKIKGENWVNFGKKAKGQGNWTKKVHDNYAN